MASKKRASRKTQAPPKANGTTAASVPPPVTTKDSAPPKLKAVESPKAPKLQSQRVSAVTLGDPVEFNRTRVTAFRGPKNDKMRAVDHLYMDVDQRCVHVVPKSPVTHPQFKGVRGIVIPFENVTSITLHP